MHIVLVAPILIPLITAVITLIFWRRIRVQRTLSLVGTSAHLIAASILFTQVWANDLLVVNMGNWQAPFGISFVADTFSAIMVMLAAIIGFTVNMYSMVDIDRQRVAFGYYPLFNVMLMGICGAFLTGDMFNLYVWFEVLLIASFVLIGLGGNTAQLGSTVKYVVINLISSSLFLTALGIVYGLLGTLNMANMAQRVQALAPEQAGLITTLSMVFLIAFGIKAALFPLYFWLPASYHTPPIAISAIFAGLLTKVGVYALIRTFTLIFVQDTTFTGNILLLLAGLTMISGVFGAMSQMDIRRVLSFHIISQIGYMIMGLGLFLIDRTQTLALIGAVFYIVHHIIVKANLFMIGGVIGWLRGTFDLQKLGGLVDSRPILALIFFISGMSLAGVPPLSGFWAKFTLIRAGLELNSIAIVIVALFVGLLTLYSMTKIWNFAFWHATPEIVTRPGDYSRYELFWYTVPTVLLATLTVIIGLSAETFIIIATTAAEQLQEPAIYIEAVCGASEGC